MQLLTPSTNAGFYTLYVSKKLSIDFLPGVKPKVWIWLPHDTITFGKWYARRWKKGKLTKLTKTTPMPSALLDDLDYRVGPWKRLFGKDAKWPPAIGIPVHVQDATRHGGICCTPSSQNPRPNESNSHGNGGKTPKGKPHEDHQIKNPPHGELPASGDSTNLKTLPGKDHFGHQRNLFGL
jgi:hypothetical protein